MFSFLPSPSKTNSENPSWRSLVKGGWTSCRQGWKDQVYDRKCFSHQNRFSRHVRPLSPFPTGPTSPILSSLSSLFFFLCTSCALLVSWAHANLYLLTPRSHIHILGTFQNIKVAKDALVSLIMGSPPGKVYAQLRTVASRMHERFWGGPMQSNKWSEERRKKGKKKRSSSKLLDFFIFFLLWSLLRSWYKIFLFRIHSILSSFEFISITSWLPFLFLFLFLFFLFFSEKVVFPSHSGLIQSWGKF